MSNDKMGGPGYPSSFGDAFGSKFDDTPPVKSEAQRLAALAQRNADLWDTYGPERLEYEHDEGDWRRIPGSFSAVMSFPLRPRQRTITVTIPRPEGCAAECGWLSFSYRDKDIATEAQRVIRAAMKEQDGG